MAMKSAFRSFGSKLRADGFVFRTAPNKLGVRVINKTGSAIAADKLVAITGFDVATKLPTIVLANASLGSHYDVYVTEASISNGAKAHVYKGAVSAANLDTSSATTAGDPVYLSGAAAGAFVCTTPVYTSNLLPVGFVYVKSASVGQIIWQIPMGMSVGVQDMVVVSYNTVAGAANTDFDGRIFIADRAYEVVGVREQHQTKGGAGATLDVVKVPSGTARASGTSVLSAAMDVSSASSNDTAISGSLNATIGNRQMAAGDSLALNAGGTLTGLDGVNVTVYLKKL